MSKDERQRVQVPLSAEEHSLLRSAVEASNTPAATLARRAIMREVRRLLAYRGQLPAAISRAKRSTERRALLARTATDAVNIAS